jgi:isoquinoline 1-oxidoreductase subunit alpha
MTTTALRLNGQALQLSTEPEMPLLWLVRGELGLTGTKFGCGMALCGACTVHLDGQPVRGCVTPVRGRRAPGGDHHRRPERPRSRGSARRLAGAGRGAVRLVPERPDHGRRRAAAQHPAPTDAQIDAALSGHLCRCGTYPRVRSAVHDAAIRLKGA